MSKLEWKLLSIATAKYPPEFPSIVIKYSWCPRTFLFLQTIAKMSKNQGNHKGIRITNQIIQSFCKNQATLVKTSGHAQFDRAVAFHTLAGKINNWGSRLTLQSISATTLLAKMYKSAFFYYLAIGASLFISRTKATKIEKRYLPIQSDIFFCF